MPDHMDMIAALNYVAQYATDLAGQRDTPEAHRDRETAARWCTDQARRLMADHEHNTEIGRRLYEMIEDHPAEQQYFELGSLARHLSEQAADAPETVFKIATGEIAAWVCGRCKYPNNPGTKVCAICWPDQPLPVSAEPPAP